MLNKLITRKPIIFISVLFLFILGSSSPVSAQTTADEVQHVLDNVWVMIAGAMVLLMQMGFALVESGWTRSKNVSNIMAKNLADMALGVSLFWAIGFSIAYSDSLFGNLFLGDTEFLGNGEGLTGSTDFFFQSVFAATAVTIVSGAVAERFKFGSYLGLGAVMTALIYPLVVRWTWGGGFIANLSIGDAVYSDFAGSIIVHAVGGFAALAAAMMVGPRIGRFNAEGRPVPMPGHSVPFVVFGVFILLFGWFGFNGGSVLAADITVMLVVLNTLLGAVAGTLSSAIMSWVMEHNANVLTAANGTLAGLVSVTAGAGTFTPTGSFIAGLIGGVIVYIASKLLEKAKIDDPVGAFPVHGVCGIWGALAVGFFARYDDAFLGRPNAGLFYGGGLDQLAIQALFAIIVSSFAFVSVMAVLAVLKSTIGLRVSEEEEFVGLDMSEHGLQGYLYEESNF